MGNSVGANSTAVGPQSSVSDSDLHAILGGQRDLLAGERYQVADLGTDTMSDAGRGLIDRSETGPHTGSTTAFRNQDREWELAPVTVSATTDAGNGLEEAAIIGATTGERYTQGLQATGLPIADFAPTEGTSGGAPTLDRSQPLPSNASRALPAGVDWSFIAAREGTRADGYVPLNRYGNPDAHSGVTIATGFDLGRRTGPDLLRLGLPNDLVSTLTPYTGHQGQAAQNYLDAHPLNITTVQQQQIDAIVFNSYYNRVANNYNADAINGMRLQDLPPGAQTAIVSVAFQYGTNLAVATPSFWRQVTTGQWQAAQNNLMSFGDNFQTRRHLEAGLMMNAIRSGTLPNQGARP